jgi:hypothetical protein
MVPTACQNALAVGRELGRVNKIGMPLKCGQEMTIGAIPHPSGVVIAGSDNAAAVR